MTLTAIKISANRSRRSNLEAGALQLLLESTRLSRWTRVIGAARPIVVGSSLGAVIALELARSYLERCTALVLIEPPMAPSDDPPDLVAAARSAAGGQTPPPRGHMPHAEAPSRFAALVTGFADDVGLRPARSS